MTSADASSGIRGSRNGVASGGDRVLRGVAGSVPARLRPHLDLDADHGAEDLKSGILGWSAPDQGSGKQVLWTFSLGAGGGDRDVRAL